MRLRGLILIGGLILACVGVGGVARAELPHNPTSHPRAFYVPRVQYYQVWVPVPVQRRTYSGPGRFRVPSYGYRLETRAVVTWDLVLLVPCYRPTPTPTPTPPPTPPAPPPTIPRLEEARALGMPPPPSKAQPQAQAPTSSPQTSMGCGQCFPNCFLGTPCACCVHEVCILVPGSAEARRFGYEIDSGRFRQVYRNVRPPAGR